MSTVKRQKNGFLRCRRCNKLAFRTVEEANEIAQRRNSKIVLTFGDFRPYWSYSCGWYHIGHSNGPTDLPIEDRKKIGLEE